MVFEKTRSPLLVTTLAVVSSPLVAQTSVTMEFVPEIGVRLHTIVSTEGSTVLGEQGAPEGSGIALEFRRREAITLRNVDRRGATLVLDVRHDSVATRARPAGGLWQAVPEETLAPAAAQVIVNEELDLLSVLEGSVRTGLVGTFDVTVPGAPVTTGEQWEGEFGLPVHARTMIRRELDLDEGFQIDSRLVATATYVVDSIVARATDTLAYVGVTGRVRSRTMTPAAQAARGLVSASGAVGGSLIWSTGWSTFVSGAIRSIVVLGVRPGMPGQDDLVLEARTDATAQFQLRP